MPYTKTVWSDEVPVTTPVKYQITDDTAGEIAASAEIALVTSVTPGTPLNASNLNKLETGVETAQAAAEAAQADADAAQADVDALETEVETLQDDFVALKPIGAPYKLPRVKSDSSGLEYVHGGMFLIEEHLCAVDEASITFSNIPQYYRHLKLVGQGRSDVVNSVITLYMQFNGDTGANYDYESISASASTVAAGEWLAQTELYMAVLAGGGAPAGCAGNFDLMIENYRGTFRKLVESITSHNFSNSSGGLVNVKRSGVWRNTDAISSIKFYTSSGNIVAGSVISLYGLI